MQLNRSTFKMHCRVKRFKGFLFEPSFDFRRAAGGVGCFAQTVCWGGWWLRLVVAAEMSTVSTMSCAREEHGLMQHMV